MNNNNTQPQDTKADNNVQQPAFQWEAPVLYTENWLKTLGGSNPTTFESVAFHT